MYELVQLSFHTHPTVRLWATNLIQGSLINYNGDPLLDFGLANFLDRISYKNPKSLDKVAAKFQSSRRMAATEQPVNLIDFSKPQAEGTGDREEEQYLYKYFKARGPREQKKATAIDEDGDEEVEIEDDEEEDPEMEAFAEKIIKDKMR